MHNTPNTIIISRTDSIGDVVLTLPVAGVLRKLYPNARILFLGRSYTQPIIEASVHIDGFLNWDEISNLDKDEKVTFFINQNASSIIHVFPNSEIARIAKQAAIPTRIGTTNRIYHWFYCNRLIRLSRRRSNLHESQLNLKLIRNLGAKKLYSFDEISELYGLVATKEPNLPVFDINNEKYKLILHPKSKGSAREWGLDRFGELIEALPEDEFHIIVTGTADEGKLMNDFIKRYSHRLTDLTGKLDLKELISVISLSDGLVAASTGPLHIAAALGINAIGIYPPIVPMHPGRWKPVGKKALHLVVNKTCNDCRKTSDCKCMREITPEQVKKLLQSTLKYKPKNIH